MFVGSGHCFSCQEFTRSRSTARIASRILETHGLLSRRFILHKPVKLAKLGVQLPNKHSVLVRGWKESLSVFARNPPADAFGWMQRTASLAGARIPACTKRTERLSAEIPDNG